MKADEKVLRLGRHGKAVGRRAASGGHGAHASEHPCSPDLALELEPALHRLGDGIEALMAAGTAADAVPTVVVAWFAEKLRDDFTALRIFVERHSAPRPARRRRRSAEE